MSINKKVKILRKSIDYTQKDFACLLSSARISVQNYEKDRRGPNYKFRNKLCNQFPEYALWLITDSIDVGSIKNIAAIDKEIDLDTIAKKIKAIRVTNNCTQVQFAELLNSSEKNIQNYENKRSIPGYKFFDTICNELPEYALWLMTDDINVESIKNMELKDE